MNDIAISADGLSKRFLLHRDRRTGLKERFIRGKPTEAQEFWALRDASFVVPKGTTFGLIGQNGSGKSTTLKVLAGIYRPTSGTVQVNGRVSALLELGAGFHGELTGRENIRLNGAILGLSNRQITAAMDSIIDFAGIGHFIDEPVKVYSSGMFVRLGFAVAISLDPEILIVDEVIAVGDEEFQRKCFDYLFDLRQRGRTIVLVHALPGHGARTSATRLPGSKEGSCASWDPLARSRTPTWRRLTIGRSRPRRPSRPPASAAASTRTGSGEIRVTAVEVLDEAGSHAPVLKAGQPCTFRLHYQAQVALDDLTFGLGFVHESRAVVSSPTSRPNRSLLGGLRRWLRRLSCSRAASCRRGVTRSSTTIADRRPCDDHARELVLAVRRGPG